MNITNLKPILCTITLAWGPSAHANLNITPEVWGLIAKVPTGIASGVFVDSTEHHPRSDVFLRAINTSADVGLYTAASPLFGMGHAIQGRYLKRGWFFTLAESGTLALAITSANTGCKGEAGGGCTVGGLAFLAANILETVDLFMGIRAERKKKKAQLSASIAQNARKNPMLKLTYSF